jgi:hypothetical protein
LIEPVIAHARRAVAAWESAAAVSRDLYHDDLTYGPQSWLRGSWHTRLPEMQAELLELEAMRGAGKYNTVQATAEVESAVAALQSRLPTLGVALEVDAATQFSGGQPFVVSARAEADEEPILHYRHVNQAERWTAMPMSRQGDRFSATIPPEYTRSDFHLQYFISLRQGRRSLLSPGLRPNLANEPYYTALQV